MKALKKVKVTIVLLVIVSILLVGIGVKLSYSNEENLNNKFSVNSNNASLSVSTSPLASDNLKYRVDSSSLTAVKMEVTPSSVYIAPRVEVYDGLTLDELALKLDRNLGDDYIAGKGYFIAKLCIEKGVDPYIAVAIILHETGCGTKCSNLARYCNNVGGQKGSPGCNGGSFKKFDTLDEGITGFINNLSKNYFSVGRDTVETIAPKYCEGNEWAGKINYFVNKIKNS